MFLYIRVENISIKNIFKLGYVLSFSRSTIFRGLSDTDADGRLSCEEFVLALHLCDLARCGETLPATLPPNLIPPSLRRVRQSSVSSNSSLPGDAGDPMAGIGQGKVNFNKYLISYLIFIIFVVVQFRYFSYI